MSRNVVWLLSQENKNVEETNGRNFSLFKYASFSDKWLWPILRAFLLKNEYHYRVYCYSKSCLPLFFPSANTLFIDVQRTHRSIHEIWKYVCVCVCVFALHIIFILFSLDMPASCPNNDVMNRQQLIASNICDIITVSPVLISFVRVCVKWIFPYLGKQHIRINIEMCRNYYHKLNWMETNLHP